MAESESPIESALDTRLYEELRRVAAKVFSQETAGHTLQPTAVVHEAYLRLLRQKPNGPQSRTQIIALAAGMMRRLLVDHARGKKTAKRGGDADRVLLDDAVPLRVSRENPIDALVMDELLTRLAANDERQARIVEMRFFSGLTISETADALRLSESTVENDWKFARAWIRRELADTPE